MGPAGQARVRSDSCWPSASGGIFSTRITSYNVCYTKLLRTIGGVEFHWIPDVGDVALVADMSSTILSRPLDVRRFGVIYAGAQKNIGPSGVTVVIVREDLLDRVQADTPSIFNYRLQA